MFCVTPGEAALLFITEDIWGSAGVGLEVNYVGQFCTPGFFGVIVDKVFIVTSGIIGGGIEIEAVLGSTLFGCVTVLVDFAQTESSNITINEITTIVMNRSSQNIVDSTYSDSVYVIELSYTGFHLTVIHHAIS